MLAQQPSLVWRCSVPTSVHICPVCRVSGIEIIGLSAASWWCMCLGWSSNSRVLLSIVNTILHSGPSLNHADSSKSTKTNPESEVGGWVQPGNRFVSFRSFVRARGVDVRWMQNEKRDVAAFPFPFSHCGIPLFPCVSLFSLCSSSWVKWDQQQTIATM